MQMEIDMMENLKMIKSMVEENIHLRILPIIKENG